MCKHNQVTVDVPRDQQITAIRPLRLQIAAAQAMIPPCPAKLAIEFDTQRRSSTYT